MVIVLCKDWNEPECACSTETEEVRCAHGPFDSQEEAETWVVFATHSLFPEDPKCYLRHEILELASPVKPW